MAKVKEKVPRTAYRAFENIVGPEWITDDPAITESYVKSAEWIDTLYQRSHMPPGVVVMPKSTEEVQRIVKVCNRYHLPFSPIGSFLGTHCGGKVPFHVAIDLARNCEIFCRNSLWCSDHVFFKIKKEKEDGGEDGG